MCLMWTRMPTAQTGSSEEEEADWKLDGQLQALLSYCPVLYTQRFYMQPLQVV